MMIMDAIICLLLGYLLGSVSPAALLGKLKNMDLRLLGTKNLGASNALIVLGKVSGAIVMVVDIAKAFTASWIARYLFPKLAVAGLLAGLGAILGHVYPFYLGFKGGKGLAAFAGMVLAYDARIFLILLLITVTAVLIVDFSAAMPTLGGILFPVLTWLKTRSLVVMILSAASGLLVVVKHWSNLMKGLRGEDIRIRAFLKKTFLTKAQN